MTVIMKDIHAEAFAGAVPEGIVPTPFHDRLAPLSKAKRWTGWAGYISPLVLDTLEFEYFAIRNQATLFDISPMHKYRISGPDAARVVNRLITRNAEKIGIGRVGYAMWCDEEGMVIDDGTVFRFGENDWRLCCQEPQYSWLLDVAWGFDVDISDESEEIAALSLQGPTSFSVLQAAGLGAAGNMNPFDLTEIEKDLWISRTGFTGDLGYEIWMPASTALEIWDRLWGPGQTWGLRAIGYEALNIARLEAGFIAAGADFQPVHIAQRLGRGRTPMELGFGRMVDFEKGHFNGRRALLEQMKKGPRYQLVRLDIDGFEPADDALIYYRGKKEVGHVTSAAWSPTTKRNIALAELKAPFGVEKFEDLWAEIFVNHEGVWDRRMKRISFIKGPFFKNARARATPPAAF
ncbi:aminomethyltransferase family protein [Hoeflea sp. TYP-13]|uniref:aminomethyltransferase family protein n=1 Tax=Hoeflea sp. TYP-13 TaxID=3230023 RepID=UPI0034C66243